MPTSTLTAAHDSSATPISDAVLLTRFRQGDSRAAAVIYNRYSKQLRRLAASGSGADLSARFDAEDVVQLVFRYFFQGASLGHYHIQPTENLWNLLTVITHNTLSSLGSYHRAAKRDVGSTTREPDWATVSAPSNHEQEFTELCLLIDDILKPLDKMTQQIIRLRLDGYQVSEIAEKTAVAQRTVERVLHEFRQQVHTKLAEDY